MKGAINKPATRRTIKKPVAKAPAVSKKELWPSLPLQEWEDTYSLVHLWTQVIGKIKLEFSEFINHWWNVTFFPSVAGLTTGIIPYKDSSFEMEFDFVNHRLEIRLDNGKSDQVELRSGSVADFYDEVKDRLKKLGIEIHIWTVPVEVEDRVPFDKDYRPRMYKPEYAHRYWKALVQVNRVLKLFRSGFTGKASPVHFFWGSLDIALTFFSGRPAPEHPGAPNVGRKVMVESYNSELASFGFWGGKGIGEAAFYAYAYPEPTDYETYPIEPQEAYYNTTFREFILPYEAVRRARNPEKEILEFYKSAFKAAAELGNWKESLYKF